MLIDRLDLMFKSLYDYFYVLHAVSSGYFYITQ